MDPDRLVFDVLLVVVIGLPIFLVVFLCNRKLREICNRFARRIVKLAGAGVVAVLGVVVAVGIPLGVIYLFVKFIRWAWYN